jgi:hypothetical protein
MARGGKQRRLTVHTRVSPTPLSAAEVATVERLVARLVAEAFLRDQGLPTQGAVRASESASRPTEPAPGVRRREPAGRRGRGARG